MNTIFNKNVATVGEGVDSETMELDEYSLNSAIRFWDTPGLGDGKEADIRHSKKIVDLLYKTYSLEGDRYGWIDTVVVILEGSSRDMGTNYRLLNEVIVPNFQKSRILVAINQADIAMKGRNWDCKENRPNDKLVDFLEEKVISIQKRVVEATGVKILKPIYYSAKYGYNVKELLDLVIDNIPNVRRELII